MSKILASIADAEECVQCIEQPPFEEVLARATAARAEHAETVKQLRQLRECLWDMASGNGGWAWEEVYAEAGDLLSRVEGGA